MASAISWSVSASVRARGVARRAEDTSGGVAEFGAHRAFPSGVPERLAGLHVGVDFGQPVEREAFAHRAHDGVMTVDGGRAAADEPDAPRPTECAASVGADVSRPGSVVDLAQRGEYRRAGVPVHGENASEVFTDDDPAVPDFAEKAALRFGGLLRFGVPERSAASVTVPVGCVSSRL